MRYANGDAYSRTGLAAGGPLYDPERVSSRECKARLGLVVSDQGIGMTPAQLAHVFERFYRADPSGNIPGTGLGMSLVKEILDQQDGEIESRSEAGIGTAVTLWLPASAEAARPGAAPTEY